MYCSHRLMYLRHSVFIPGLRASAQVYAALVLQFSLPLSAIPLPISPASSILPYLFLCIPSPPSHNSPLILLLGLFTPNRPDAEPYLQQLMLRTKPTNQLTQPN